MKRLSSGSDASVSKRSNRNACDRARWKTEEEPEYDETLGILRRIILRNFMCHEHLDFKIDPGVNLVQGSNGSGKSAILTGVVIALGGGARVTNRGFSLKTLVMDGKNSCSAEVHLNNGGSGGYQHSKFGNTIMVERKLSSSGVSTYKIKSASGLVVSTKKEYLKKIMNYFGIDIENPVTVLNQDMSRSFLNTADPRKLFSFFMKAIHFQEVQESVTIMESNLCASQALLMTHKQNVSRLQVDVEDLKKKYDFILALNDRRLSMKELRRELTWAHVEAMEAEIVSKMKELHGYSIKLNKLTDVKPKLIEQKQQYQASLNEVNDRLVALSNSKKDKTVSVDKLKLEVQKEKTRLKEFKSGEMLAEGDVQKIERNISIVRETIQKDRDPLKNEWAAKEATRENEIKESEAKLRALQEAFRTEETHHQNLFSTLKEHEQEVKRLQAQHNAISFNCEELRRQLRQMQAQTGSSTLSVFGHWVVPALKDIDRAMEQGMFEAKPVGPLGSFIEVKDKKWAHVVEFHLKKNGFAFCANSMKDRRVLEEILCRHVPRLQLPPIIVSKYRTKAHDVSRYAVVCPAYPSLWSVMKISNIHVANALIDMLRIETVLLIDSADEAADLLSSSYTVPHNCSLAYTLNCDVYYPDPDYRVYSGQGRNNTAKYIQVSVADKISDMRKNLECSQAEVETMKRDIVTENELVRKFQNAAALSLQKQNKYKAEMGGVRRCIVHLQAQEEPPPPDVSQLEADIAELEKEREAALAKKSEFHSKYQENLAKLEALQDQYKSCVHQNEQALKDISEIQLELTSKERDLDNASNKLDVWGKKYKELEKIMAQHSDSVLVLQSKFEKDFAIANEHFSPVMKTSRSPLLIEKELKAIQKRVNEQENLHGNREEIERDYKVKLARLESLCSYVKQCGRTISKLKDCCEERKLGCEKFLQCARANLMVNFQNALRVRNLKGCLEIDLAAGTLSVSARKPSVTPSPVKGKRSLAMMSGGERSFTTVSFLLALWSIVSTPFRILDEFDVFMDMVSRQQSLEMLIRAAKPFRQYIYLTPVPINVNNYNLHIYRMPEPERRERDNSSRRGLV